MVMQLDHEIPPYKSSIQFYHTKAPYNKIASVWVR